MTKLDLFINDINNSNCYVLQDQGKGNCIIIDPGSRDVRQIIDLLKYENLKLDYIFLTHSHFDHIAGVSLLLEFQTAKIVSSRLCSEKIIDPIKNLSYFADYGIVTSPKADIFIEDLPQGIIEWNDNIINLFNSPGHTLCSICILIGKRFFTGDTIIRGIKTKITYPDGKRQALKQTLEYIYENLPGDLLVFPGHGESFILETQPLSVSLNK